MIMIVVLNCLIIRKSKKDDLKRKQYMSGGNVTHSTKCSNGISLVGNIVATNCVVRARKTILAANLIWTLRGDGYTVQLPKTEDGFMVYLVGTITGVPFVEEYYAAFGGYIKHKDGRRAYAEELSVFRNEDDVVVALDGSDLSGRPLSELVLQITSAPIGTIIKLTMINKSAFNGRYYRSVKKANG